MEKFELLEHKADLKIRAFGRDKKELFLNSMLGMYKGAGYESKAKSQKSRLKIKISSLDLPSLLVDFLNEVLYFTETKKLVFEGVDFKKMTNKEIEVTLIGKPLKRMGVHIKAVTYHNLDVHQEKNGMWQAVILFDI